VQGGDTLFQAPAAVASGVTLVHGGRSWTFRTPPGQRRVLRKVVNPVWTPPDWHYAEAARDHGLRLTSLTSNGAPVSGGRRLEIRGGVVGIIRPGEPFKALPVNEHIVFDGRLFIPPAGTRNRRLQGDLGRYALDLGDGYMIHGTPYQASIGRATTHGCIRLRDRDIAWLYEHIPIGTRVVIH
jgi:lipoprotein-anchoring transpeptidase ErfK/SrfK